MSKWYEYDFFIESGYNASFDYQQFVDLRDYIEESRWQKMSEEEQEAFVYEIAKEIAFDDYINFGLAPKSK